MIVSWRVPAWVAPVVGVLQICSLKELKMNKQGLLALVVAGIALVGVAAWTPTLKAAPGADGAAAKSDAPAAPKPKSADWTPKVKPGDTAPDFTLTDTDGKTFKLADAIKANKAVVLEWFNPECPFVVKHHEKNPTFANLHKQFADKGVLFVAINSGAPGEQGAGKQKNIDAKKNFKIAYQILMDESGDVGRSYGALTTPHMIIITPDGKVAFNGAIDNDRSQAKAGSVNYVEQALKQILAGETVAESTARPYGCSVKYGKSRKE